MFLIIEDLLESAALNSVTDQLKNLSWRDGRETAGAAARAVKQNSQADLSSKAGAALSADVMTALRAHPVLQAAARAKRFSRLLVSKTETGGGYGVHVDNAIMGAKGAALRSDLAFTLFLNAPKDYDGGELEVDLPGMTQSLKLHAGSLVLYPASALHQVCPVTSGARIVCVGWIESRVRLEAQREILFDLSNLRASLAQGGAANGTELLTLDKSIANLLRLWADS